MAQHDLLRRVGRFSIAENTIRNAPELALEILAGCLVLRAEMMFHTGSVEYVAAHPDFRVHPEGEFAPTYIADLRQDDDGPHFVGWFLLADPDDWPSRS